MTVEKVSAIYFSPTGTTKSVMKHMLTEFDIQREEIDLTPYENKDNVHSFDQNEIVFVGIPVYGGRIPSAAENRIKLLKGNNTPIVLIATYGNIHFSNALFELQQIVIANGFITIAAAVIVSQHNVVNKIAAGRPNAQDLTAISSFVKQIQAKLSRSNCLENIVLKGKMPKTPRDMQPIKPHGNKKCAHCGVCGKLCPAQAIEDPRETAGQACIRCMRCIKYCPQNARTYGKLKKVGARLLLSFASRGEEKQPEFFL